jgi:uncharacterized protein
MDRFALDYLRHWKTRTSRKPLVVRDARNVDFVIAVRDQVVPVEVKAGTLKSMHVFLQEKHRGFGLRFNMDRLSLLEVRTSVAASPQTPFKLLSLPLYLVGQAFRLCEAVLSDKA